MSSFSEVSLPKKELNNPCDVPLLYLHQKLVLDIATVLFTIGMLAIFAYSK